LFAWSAGHCVIRWEYHRGYMDNGVEPMALEGLLHAVWPLALVVGAAHATRLAPGRDTVRAYLHDLQSIWATAIWPALAFACLGLWLIYNPWWGVAPAQAANALSAVVALALMLSAAALSYISPDVPHARWMKWLVRAATVACAVHLFVAATVAVRWLYHGAEMSTATAGEVELWVYSAVWALLGTAALVLGTMRNDPILRWIGLGIFFLTIIKVFVVDTARLSEIARGASFIILAVFAGAATWLARRNRPAPSPGDLVTVTPSARRERRRVRRRTST
jgi:energy-converting hydrogenase Eha subunit E